MILCNLHGRFINVLQHFSERMKKLNIIIVPFFDAVSLFAFHILWPSCGLKMCGVQSAPSNHQYMCNRNKSERRCKKPGRHCGIFR
jgi:hypothetical protein